MKLALEEDVMTAAGKSLRRLVRAALVVLAFAMAHEEASAFDKLDPDGLQVADVNPLARPRGTRAQRIQACERKVFSDFNRCADVCEASFPADEPANRELCTRACESEAQRGYRKCDKIL